MCPPKSCVYCGATAEHRDHVVPCAWSGDRHYETLTVPACGKCNRNLSSTPLFTIPERREFLIGKFSRKLRHLLNTRPSADETLALAVQLDNMKELMRCRDSQSTIN